jgi:hypothetical protein
MTYDKKTLQYIKDLGEKVDLTTVQEFTPRATELFKGHPETGNLSSFGRGISPCSSDDKEIPTWLNS